MDEEQFEKKKRVADAELARQICWGHLNSYVCVYVCVCVWGGVVLCCVGCVVDCPQWVDCVCCVCCVVGVVWVSYGCRVGD